jgi:hypothetical protein
MISPRSRIETGGRRWGSNVHVAKRRRFAWWPVRLWRLGRYAEVAGWVWLRCVIETDTTLEGWIVWKHDLGSIA